MHGHITVEVSEQVPAAYYKGWWHVVGYHEGTRVLRSRRVGPDADTDLVVLRGRLASGLHPLPREVDA